MENLITAERARELRRVLDDTASCRVADGIDGHMCALCEIRLAALGEVSDKAEHLLDTVIAQDAVIVRLMSEPQDMKALREENAGLGVERDDLRDELAEAHALIARQRAILDGVANALKGEHASMMHDHSDLAEIAKETVERETAHGNLLAVIHRDGGHYVSRYGWKQAAKDAERVVIEMRARVQELEHGVTMLRDLEASAVKSLETDNARLRATARTLYCCERDVSVTHGEFKAAMAHGAELIATVEAPDER